MPGNDCYAPLNVGNVLYQAVANPGAGVNLWSWTIPAGWEYQPQAIFFRIVSDANAGVRLPLIVAYRTIDGIDMTRIRFPGQGPNLTIYYCLYLRAARSMFFNTNLWIDALPDMRISAGDQVGCAVTAFAVGDQIQNIRIVAKGWRVP